VAIWKRAVLESEREGEPLARIIEPGAMVKTASAMVPEVQSYISKLAPDPKYTYVLVNAMGYSEYFGPNSNKDYYGHNPHLSFNGLLHAPPDWGADPCKDMAHGKKWLFGYPTFYGASVYAHHKNSCPDTLGFGEVVFVMPNHRMKRIELVMRIDNLRAQERGRESIVSRIRNHERVDVSMGCFKAGARVSLADGTQKPIEDIQVGDRVRTHTGSVGRVSELHRRKYRGEFFEIRPANEQSLYATKEHPFLAAHSTKNAYRVWKKEEPQFSWEYAKDLESAVLCRPKVTKTIDPKIGREWARLLGYYLAEGSLVFAKCGRLSGISLSTHREDAVHLEIEELCATAGVASPWTHYPEDRENSATIYVYSEELAQFCVDLTGRYSKKKKLSEGVLYWPHDLQLELLGAYANGDGYSSKNGSLSFSTSSTNLAAQLREILFRLGIPTSCNRLVHKAGSGFSNYDTIEYVVYIGRQWAPRLAHTCAKVRVVEVLKTKNIFKEYGDQWAVPIREFESFYTEDEVYNLEVEGDNSYIVNGVAVHNCKVPFDLCSITTDWKKVQQAWDTFDPGRHLHPGIAILQYHKGVSPVRGLSITRADYSEPMRLHPGQILPDGQKVFVYNDFPRFFDISFVWIGADKTARVMWFLGDKKPATQVREQVEISPGPITVIRKRRVEIKMAMEKRAEGAIFFKGGEIEKEVPATYAKKIELHAMREPDMPLDILSGAAGRFGAKALLSSLASLGIVLKPQEFHVVVTKGRPMSEKLASLAISQGAEFDTDQSSIDDTHSVSGDSVNPDLARVFKPMVGTRSSFSPHLGLRTKGPAPQESTLKKESVLRSDLMNEVAAQYNGYRLSVLEQSPEIFPQYALLWDPDPESLLKVGSLGLAPLLLGLGPVIHLVSAHLRKKRETGAELGAVAKFVADNPTFLSMSTIGAGLRAAVAVQRAGGLGTAVKGVMTALRYAA
jgi:hypothetical protein